MTDNEIVKALEYWKQFDKDIDTLQSTHPQYADMWDEQKEVVKITFEVFEEVNRQKAEIEKNENIIRLADKTIETANAEVERLKTNLNIELENYATEYDNKIKAEAYREFAERLKEKAKANEWNGTICGLDIDNLLKELVGEENECKDD